MQFYINNILLKKSNKDILSAHSIVIMHTKIVLVIIKYLEYYEYKYAVNVRIICYKLSL